MTEGDTSPPEVTRLNSSLQAAVLAIRWERLWRVLWAPLGVAVLFVGISLTDILPILPTFLHAGALALLAVLFGYSCLGFASALKPVSGEEAARRVETTSGLSHRPLTALFDRPANEKLSADAQALWHAHVARAMRQVEHLKMPSPKPGVAARDLRGLRFIPVLVLFVGVLMGGGDPLPRLARAVQPFDSGSAIANMQMDVWITPPAYTGLAPHVFSGLTQKVRVDDEAKANATASEPQSLIVPVGSKVLVQATDAPYPPLLEVGSRAESFERLGGKASTSYKLEMDVSNDAVGAERLRLSVGGSEVAAWSVTISPDAPPAVEFERAPSKRGDSQLDVAYIATDDYGVKKLEMDIRRPNGRAVPGGDANILVEVPLSGDRRNINTSTSRNFSAHPWAGLPVKVKLIAEDTAGQVAETDSVEVVLPERIFNHPVARSLADARKALNDADADLMSALADQLHELSFYPKRFFDDTVAFLAIRSAAGRLGYADDIDVVPSVQKILWETALRIEDGEFALAEADLMRLQEEAMKALRDGKLGEELESVMRELQEAMDRYMQALAERLDEMGLDQIPPMANMPQMETRDIQEMLDRIKELAETGNREAAEQQLAQMQRMLEQLRNGLKNQNTNPALAKAKKLMDAMRSLTEDQQKLLDRTFQESLRQGRRQQGQQGQQQGQQGQQDQQQGQQGQKGQQPQPGEGGAPSAEEQAALRGRLGELMMQMDEMLGQIPDNMGRAEQQMEQAGKNMGKGELSDAARNQTQALQELRGATNKMAEALAQQMGAQTGLATGSRPSQGGDGGFDPFGRRRGSDENGLGSAVEDADVSLPSRMEMRRAREILDELRKRSGERTRPQLELDYIDRLLDVF